MYKDEVHFIDSCVQLVFFPSQYADYTRTDCADEKYRRNTCQTVYKRLITNCFIHLRLNVLSEVRFTKLQNIMD